MTQDWHNRIVGHGEEAPDQLLAHPLNFRVHPKAQQDALRGVIGDIGYIRSVLVNRRTGHVIDGHLRVALALRDGVSSIPVEYVDLSDAEEAEALATIDPLAAMATHDAAKLDDLLREVTTGDAAVQALLDDLATAARIVPGMDATPGAGGDGFDTTPAAGPTRTQPGDLWQLGRHRLLVGDCTVAANVARLMDGRRARLLVTSPPYNQQLDSFKPSGMQKESPAFVQRMASSYADDLPEDEYQRLQIDFVTLWGRSLTPDGSIFYNHKIRYRDKRIISPLEWLIKAPYAIRQEIIWDRGSSITLNARMFIPADERIYWLRVGDDFIFNDTPEIKAWSSVWEVAAVNEVRASAAFAVEIPTRCIRAASLPGDIVVDPFLGSGTTLIAADRTGRTCYGCEISPQYADVILRRFEAETGQAAVKLSATTPAQPERAADLVDAQGVD